MNIGEDDAGHGERRAAAMDQAHAKGDREKSQTIGLNSLKKPILTMRERLPSSLTTEHIARWRVHAERAPGRIRRSQTTGVLNTAVASLIRE